MARPPVCKLMDYGKFKYESALKARESRKNQAQTVIKEIKLRPKIDPHDYGTKKGHVERFLKQGDKVKVTIMFRGREQSRPELGFKLLQKLAADVEELGFVESTPKQDGRNMIMVIGPHKRKTDAMAAARAERATRSRASGQDDTARSGPTEAAFEPADEDSATGPAAAEPAAAEPAAPAAAPSRQASSSAAPARPARPASPPSSARAGSPSGTSAAPRPAAPPRPQPRPGPGAASAAPKPTAPRTAASPAARPGAGSAAPKPTAPRGTAATARSAASGSAANAGRPVPSPRPVAPGKVAADKAAKPSAAKAPPEGGDSES
jgi:translation initiation factor IF-3